MDGTAPSLATVLRPPLSDLDQLVEPLTEAESQVAQALAGLTDGWTVYVQPRLGLDQPDFVAVHDRLGVCAIEVKGWLPHAVRQNDDGDLEFSGESGQWTASGEQPRFDASRYRNTIFDQFYAMPEDGDTPPPEVRAIVVLPYFTTEQATQLFERPGVHDGEELVGVWGGDALPAFDDVIGGFGCQSPRQESIDKLRSHIVPSERVTGDSSSIAALSPGAADIADNPRQLRARRVRGAAGSGKTYGLTARAARLAAEGKRVLVLSFNVTLANHLRALATARCREIGANATLITCTNFHTFCTRVVQDAEVAGHQLVSPSGAPWTVAIVAKAEQAYAQGFRRQYDAVLIDEGQDFTGEWWQLLRKRAVTPEGEMLVVADPTQDLYGRYSWTADDSIAGAGFSGDWTDLGSGGRLPADVAAFLSGFAASHVEGERLALERDDHAGDSVRHWVNVERINDLGRSVGEEVVRVLRDNPTLSPGDVTFLCEYHHDGVAAVRVIEQAGIPVHHVFSRDPDAPRRRRKHRFWPGAPAVKGCTTHSFKGWETPALVVGIGSDTRSKATAYVALTRVSTPGDGRPAVVSVLNANRSLSDLQSAFVAGSASPARVERSEPAAPVAVEATVESSPLAPPTPFVPDAGAPLTPPAPDQSAATDLIPPANGAPRSLNGTPASMNGTPPSTNGEPGPLNGTPASMNGGPGPLNGTPQPLNGTPAPSTNGMPRPLDGTPQPLSGTPAPSAESPTEGASSNPLPPPPATTTLPPGPAAEPASPSPVSETDAEVLAEPSPEASEPVGPTVGTAPTGAIDAVAEPPAPVGAKPAAGDTPLAAPSTDAPRPPLAAPAPAATPPAATPPAFAPPAFAPPSSAPPAFAPPSPADAPAPSARPWGIADDVAPNSTT